MCDLDADSQTKEIKVKIWNEKTKLTDIKHQIVLLKALYPLERSQTVIFWANSVIFAMALSNSFSKYSSPPLALILKEIASSKFFLPIEIAFF